MKIGKIYNAYLYYFKVNLQRVTLNYLGNIKDPLDIIICVNEKINEKIFREKMLQILKSKRVAHIVTTGKNSEYYHDLIDKVLINNLSQAWNDNSDFACTSWTDNLQEAFNTIIIPIEIKKGELRKSIVVLDLNSDSCLDEIIKIYKNKKSN